MARTPVVPSFYGSSRRRRVVEVADPATDPRAEKYGPKHGAKAFVGWCAEFVIVEAKEGDVEGGQEVAFVLWPGQLQVVDDLVAGRRLVCLKGRQLGLTILVAAFVLWKVVYVPMFHVTIINQEGPYAEAFIRKVRWMHEKLPEWMAPKITTDNKKRLAFVSPAVGDEGVAKRCEIVSVVGGPKAARSVTGDMCIFDEAAFIPDFKATRAAVTPAMTRSTSGDGRNGQIICLTTSSGPIGEFKEFWDATYGESGEVLDDNGIGPLGYKPVFLHWSGRPGRDQAWYDRQAAELGFDVKREYPNDIDEAFEYGEGRVYSLFTRKRNVGSIEIPKDAQRGRLIDWGEARSAFVVLWFAYIPGPPGFLVHPDCRNTIREFLGYRLGPDGRPVKEADHTCDCVRYGVVAHRLRGLMYVYREVYRLDSVKEGWNPLTEIADIHQQSGWVKAGPEYRRPWRRGRQGETYKLRAVADRSLGKMINLFKASGIPCTGSPTIREMRDNTGRIKSDAPRDELIDGIKMVAVLIDGTEDIHHFHEVTRDEAVVQEYKAMKRRGRIGTGEEGRRIATLAREILAAQDRRNARRGARDV